MCCPSSERNVFFFYLWSGNIKTIETTLNDSLKLKLRAILGGGRGERGVEGVSDRFVGGCDGDFFDEEE